MLIVQDLVGVALGTSDSQSGFCKVFSASLFWKNFPPYFQIMDVSFQVLMGSFEQLRRLTKSAFSSHKRSSNSSLKNSLTVFTHRIYKKRDNIFSGNSNWRIYALCQRQILNFSEDPTCLKKSPIFHLSGACFVYYDVHLAATLVIRKNGINFLTNLTACCHNLIKYKNSNEIKLIRTSDLDCYTS